MFTKSEIEKFLHSLKNEIETARSCEDHQGVVDASIQILDIASHHPELRIAEFIFLRKIAKAYEKIGNKQNALHYFRQSLDAAKQLEKKDPIDLSKEILALENKIKHL